jgi:hypothetical protein
MYFPSFAQTQSECLPLLPGTLLCVVVMFMMDWKTALATYLIVILLCLAIQVLEPGF